MSELSVIVSDLAHLVVIVAEAILQVHPMTLSTVAVVLHAAIAHVVMTIAVVVLHETTTTATSAPLHAVVPVVRLTMAMVHQHAATAMILMVAHLLAAADVHMTIST
jgi:hypothetical protein